MPLVTMPNGDNVQFPDNMPREQIRSLIATKFPEVAPQPAEQKAPTFGENVINNFVGGLEAGKDIVTGNFEMPNTPLRKGNVQITPAVQNLADKLFPEGSEGTAMDALRNIPNTVPSDYSKAFLEKFAANPAGKAVTAIGGVMPLANVAGSAYQTYARPQFEKIGIAPENVDAALLIGGGIGSGIKMATSPAKALTAPKQQTQFSPRAVSMTAKELKSAGVTPEQVTQVMQEAQAKGINLTVPEAAAQLTRTPEGAAYIPQSPLITKQRVLAQSSTPAADIIGKATAGRMGQVVDTLKKQGQQVVEAGEAAAKPLYEAVRKVQLDDNSVGALVNDPIISQAIKTISKDSQLKNLIRDLPQNSVGYFDEVKKYLDAEKKSSTLNNRLKSLYTDATQKITGVLDTATPEYAQARAAAQPAIVAKKGILKPIAKSDSIATMKNQIFGSPEKRAELQRGLGAEGYKNISDLMDIVERVQRTAKEGSDTEPKIQARQSISSGLSDVGNVATGGKLGLVRSTLGFIDEKINQKRWGELAELYTTRDIKALRSALQNAEPKSRMNVLQNFLTNKVKQVPDSATMGIPAAIANQPVTVQTPPVTLPNATQPSTMDVVPFEQMMPEAQPNTGMVQPTTREGFNPSPQSSITPDLIDAEGVRNVAYKDHLGNRTIGIGFNMDSPNAPRVWQAAGVQTDFNAARTGKAKLSLDEVQNLADVSYKIAVNDARQIVPNFDQLGENQKAALVQLSYQMGGQRLSGFKNMINKIAQGDTRGAAYHLLNSKYAKEQTPARAKLVARMLAFDEPYKGKERLSASGIQQVSMKKQKEIEEKIKKIPPPAIEDLKQNPQYAADFDQVFGAGLSRYILA